jgi:hypothetical protein
MSFGQASGPPATAKQVRELQELLEAAGHSDFRDARGPMGFTQRQAGGKFTRDEAQAFIDQLEAEALDAPTTPSAPAVAAAPRPKAAARPAAAARPTTATSTVATSTAVPAAPRPSAPAKPQVDASGKPLTPMERALRAATGDQLADELRRRGWRTVER